MAYKFKKQFEFWQAPDNTRVSDQMLNPIHFLDYLNFGALFDISFGKCVRTCAI